MLKSDKDFNALYKRGKSIGGKYVVLFYKKNNLDYNRTAFLASKKVGNSVKRNRARRLMKESNRHICDRVKPGFDILFIARKTITERNAKCQDVERSMLDILKKGRLLKEED